MTEGTKILILTDGITPFVTGGMQRHSANLARYLTEAGALVSLAHCVPHGTNIPSAEEVNQSLFGSEASFQLSEVFGFNFPQAGKIPGHYVRNSYAYSKLLFKSIDFSQYDFVYAKGFSAWYAIEQKKKGVPMPPIGVKFHGYEMFQELPSLRQRLEAKLLRKPTRWNNENADYIFSYGGKITDLILEQFKVTKDSIIEFPSGISQDWLLETEPISDIESLRKFVFVGRYERRKGVEELSSVIKSLIKEGLKFEMHFVGPIPEEARLTSNQVIYHGELKSKEALTRVLDQTEILLCPSHSEGMPNVILEGMARGNAILATKVGAVEKLVNESCGWLIEPCDELSLEETFKLILKLDQPMIEKKRVSSWQRVKEEFNWSKLAEAILENLSKRKKN